MKRKLYGVFKGVDNFSSGESDDKELIESERLLKQISTGTKIKMLVDCINKKGDEKTRSPYADS